MYEVCIVESKVYFIPKLFKILLLNYLNIKGIDSYHFDNMYWSALLSYIR